MIGSTSANNGVRIDEMYRIMTNNSRLVLGTAQLGMPYGIANRTGQPSIETAREIVLTAWNNDICEFDTAGAYGQSEKILGEIFKDLTISDQVKITTKPDPELNHLDAKCMIQALEQSLDRLHVNKLHCIMLHREDLLDLWEKGLHEILESFVQKGLVDHIGVSVYSPQRALQAILTKGIQIVQLPTNILDRRFEKAGIFELSKEHDKEIYIRSIFLQGLLLMKPEELSRNMSDAKKVLEEIRAIAVEKKVTIRHLALGYIKASKPKAKLIIGVEQVSQLNGIINDANIELPLETLQEILNKFHDVDEKIINPIFWQR